jgi:outer membrane protein assembly factor BamB
MVALDPATGATKWTAKLPSPAASLAAADGQLFVPTQEKELLAYRITAEGLKRMWRHRDRSIAAVGAAAIGSRRVFYSMMDNTLKAFDRSGGTKVWTASLDSRPVAGPMLLGDDAIVPLASGDLAQISAATGRTPAKTDKPQAGRPGLVATAFFDGSAYVVLAERNETARLVAWRAAK